MKPLLHKDLKGKPRVKSCNYRSLVEIIIYLQGTIRPNIIMAVHQCAHFSSNLMLSYKRAITRIGRYLLDTKDKGSICKINRLKGLECYVDADFTGG